MMGIIVHSMVIYGVLGHKYKFILRLEIFYEKQKKKMEHSTIIKENNF